MTTNLERFIRERSADWDELELLVAAAGRRPERLGAERLLRLGARYRAVAADLALARRAFPGDPVVWRLDDLVGRARHLVYDTRLNRGSLVRFVTRDYWRLVAEKPAALAAATVLVFGTAALAGLWAQSDPGAAIGVVPQAFRPAVEPGHPWRHMSAGDQAAFTTEVFTNNIGVTLAAFAGGITVGIFTALALVYNGLILGAVAGLMISGGNGRGFVELVTAHGVLELSCILVAGAAGLRVGWAIVEPGRLTRRASVVHEARHAVAIALGTAPWLVVAGIVEGNRANLADAGLEAVIGVGAGLGVLYWGLVYWRGFRGGRATLPADTP